MGTEKCNSSTNGGSFPLSGSSGVHDIELLQRRTGHKRCYEIGILQGAGLKRNSPDSRLHKGVIHATSAKKREPFEPKCKVMDARTGVAEKVTQSITVVLEGWLAPYANKSDR
jgi:hypothetical protein